MGLIIESGAGYGLKILAADLDAYLKREWGSVDFYLPTPYGRAEVNIDKPERGASRSDYALNAGAASRPVAASRRASAAALTIPYPLSQCWRYRQAEVAIAAASRPVLFFHPCVHPRGLQAERRQAHLPPCAPFSRVSADGFIAGDHHPIAFRCQLAHPGDVARVSIRVAPARMLERMSQEGQHFPRRTGQVR